MKLEWVMHEIMEAEAQPNSAKAVYDLAALLIVRNYLSGGQTPRSQQYTAGRQIGFQSNGEESFDKETAHEWVENMKDSSGNVGGKYSWTQAHQYAVSKGITSDKKIAEFYAAMNAMYSDFHAAGEKFGVDTPDFYACLAKLFMDDPDAVNDKMAMYYKYIVKHEE